MTQCNSVDLVMRARRIALVTTCGVALLGVALWAPTAQAYPLYDDPGSSNDWPLLPRRVLAVAAATRSTPIIRPTSALRRVISATPPAAAASRC